MNTAADCFGCFNRNRCIITVHIYCKGPSCALYKTRAKMELSRKQSEKRLASLDPDLQRCIANKYYRGRQAWKKPATSGLE